MIPEKLVLEGLYSYKNRTEIDFSILCKAELFGIFGRVGSGKSAVLEAITFVLYGRIERLPSKMMNYNMMNLASGLMSIDFIFRHKDERYRFTFEAKRNKKDFTKIETPKRSAYLMKKGDWQPLFDKDGEVAADSIIGLNYDNFRRTVIVPQGRFQEFLHLEKSKRTEMLMELFQLNRFDLFAKAASLSARNTEAVASIEGTLIGLGEADEKNLSDAVTEQDKGNQESRRLAELVSASDIKLRGFEELSALAAQLSETEAELELKKVQTADIEHKKAQLVRYEDCRGRFESRMHAYSVLTDDMKQVGAELEISSDAVERSRAAFRIAESEFEKLSEEYKSIEELKKQAEWFFELSRIENDRTALMLLEKHIEEARVKTDQLRNKKEEGAKELTRLMEQCADAGADGRTAEFMGGLNNLYKSINDCDKNINTETDRLESEKTERKSLQDRIESFGGIDEAEKFFEKREYDYKRDMLDAEIAKGIEKLVLQLEDGKPCPVCGATEHPCPVSIRELSGTELQRIGDELERERLRLKESRRTLAALQTEAAAADGRIEALSGQLESRKAEKAALLREFPDCEFNPGKPDDFRTEYEHFLHKQRLREELQTGITDLNKHIESLSEDINAAAEVLNNLRLEDATVRTRISETEQRMNPAFLSDNRGRPAAELAGEGKLLREKSASISAGYNNAEAVLKKNSLDLEAKVTETAILTRRAGELSVKITAAESELSGLLESSAYRSLEEVSMILSEKRDVQAERAGIERFERDFAVLSGKLDNLRDTINKREYSEGGHQLEAENNKRLKHESENLNRRLGELKNMINDLSLRIERKKALEDELSELKIRGENLNTLKNLFKGKQFIDYAATVYLRELCEAANVRFRKLTRESLRLELDEANNFIIRDYLNEGKTRSVKTLSGGQTFQAAFSLSLALADSIGRERSGFFFLDEGFGSLDRESLSLIFESLKSLKKEERTVGIISHVEELKQEIDTFITVEKDNEEGSRIINSWNS